MGVVSLFSDMTHEGARSILGPFLSMTGASATAVAVVSGAGELCGYSLRLLSGFVADKTKKYWTLVIAGYALQVAAVPALALVGQGGYVAACALVILERIAKAVKKPAKNTLVSFAASDVGMGKGFAYQEVLDQLGAFAGPVALFVLSHIRRGGTFETYRLCFAALAIPAAITIAFTLIAHAKYPHPEMFEEDKGTTHSPRSSSADALSAAIVPPSSDTNGNTTNGNTTNGNKGKSTLVFVIYMAGISLFAFGFADFPLLSLHAAKAGAFGTADIALLYALAMLVDAVSALVFGTLFDRIGALSLALSTFAAAAFAPLVFVTGSKAAIIAGIALWGVGMGAEESVMKACVAKVVSKEARSRGFGVAETGFGVAWFLGSVVMGLLYSKSLIALSLISVLSLLASGAVQAVLWKRTKG